MATRIRPSGAPLNMEEAGAEGLLLTVAGGVRTFSNGSEHESWAYHNCWECQFWDPEELGAECAFEGASMLDLLTPELAKMFGWIQAETQYGPMSGWGAPPRCAFFRLVGTPPPPVIDPAQLSLLSGGAS